MMLAKADMRLLSSLASLETNEEFRLVIEWLNTSLAELHYATPAIKDEVLLRWQQGASQMLQEFLSTAKAARSVVRR